LSSILEKETRPIGNVKVLPSSARKMMLVIPEPCPVPSISPVASSPVRYTPLRQMANLTMGPDQAPSNIRILSLNCWGLKFIAKLRNERLEEIGNQIAAADPRPDIVGLQECWTQQDYNVIREKTNHFLPYGKFYHSGIFGGGLVILSRWPIEDSNMVRYPLNGRPAAFYRGDWFVGKGVACARIRIGPGRKDVAEVFCTHVGSLCSSTTT
jgi:hypothetical protein